jgi:multidrug efflux pump subunit AcrA (membrane-fusion protein)
MSTDQSLDPNLIEQTKHQIRSLVNEIAQLSKSDLGPQEYYGEFLNRVVSALAANGGAVWSTDQGRLGLAYQIKLQDTRLPEKSEEEQIQHGRLLQKVMTTGEGALIAPHSGGVDGEQGANPTEFLLVLGPLKTELETVGVVEVFQRPDAPMGAQKGYLRFLMQMCELAGDYLKSRQLRHFSDRQVLWSQLEEFARVVHASLDPRDAAYTIANEGRRLIECDRVSVAIRKGRKCHVEAISGQDLFDKRSNTVRLLGRLATAVVDSDEPMWYTGDTTKMAPQVEEAVQEYVDDSHSKTVAVLPLRREKPVDDETDLDTPREPSVPVGALIVEQIEDSRVPEKMLHRVEVVTQHSSTALANALEHQNLFLMPLWRALGKAKWVVQARTLPKTIGISVGVVSAILILCFWPADFEVNCKGTLEPVQRRSVFANVEGTINGVKVKHNQEVKKGALLVTMEDTTLAVEIARVNGEIASTRERINTLQRTLQSSGQDIPESDRVRMQGQLEEAAQLLSSQQRELQLYQQKQRDLNVCSPADGVVTTWQPYDHLIYRPVKRGDMLLEVADPSREWQLELQMPDNKMGYITEAQQEIGDDLDVEYILASEPNQRHRGRVKEVHYSAEVHGDEGNTVLIKVGEIDKADLPPLRPGQAVNAKVFCGRRAIGFVLLHDFIAWIQARVLFPWF